jgi:hypothetical protein
MPNLDNRYVAGAGVGASSVASRRAKLIRSTSCTGAYPCNNSFYRLGLQYNGAPTSTPGPPATVPDPPTNLNVSYVSGTTYIVAFNAPINNGGSQITGYKLNYTDSNGTNYNINISSGDNVQLTSPSTYTFTVRATNSVGTSIPSTPPFIIIVYPPSVPDPPRNVSLTNIDPDLVGVNFNAPINTGGNLILSYTITCTAVGRPDIIIAPITTNSLSNQITLPQGVSYTITVIATNVLGNSSPSSTSTPPSITPISNPTPTITQFTTTGSTTWTAPATATSVSYLVVGGGGGGGGAFDNSAGGGGGAGLVLTGTMNVTPGQTYNVNVGTGGAGAIRPSPYSNPAAAANNNNGSPGNSSSFDLIVAGGGGFGYKSRTGATSPTPYGGSQASGSTPPTGGSGGDGGGDGGGGGGNGSAGTAGGQGGSGITSSISGSLKTYGAGGNGGANSSNSPGTSGQVNTGNGGQGGGSLSFNNMGGAAGGSGIVIIRFNT